MIGRVGDAATREGAGYVEPLDADRAVIRDISDEYGPNDEAELVLLRSISEQCGDFLGHFDSERVHALYEHVGRTLWKIKQGTA